MLTHFTNITLLVYFIKTFPQHLLQRSPFVKDGLNSSGIYDNQTVAAVAAFQHGHALHVTSEGSLDAGTALLLLKLHACDGYRDEGRPASSYGAQFLYKILISVHANRSIETNATLFDKVCNTHDFVLRGRDALPFSITIIAISYIIFSQDNNVLHTYRVRAHGQNVDGPHSWPTYSHTPGLNSLSTDGNTPTGDDGPAFA